MGTRNVRFVFIAAVVAGSTAANAEIPAPLDRVSVSLGTFNPTVDARVAVNGPGIAGTQVNFQRDLNIDKHQTLPNFRVDLLVFDSQGFSIGGYRYMRHASAALSRDIRFDGDELNASASADARVRLKTYTGSWHWWLAPTASDVFGLGLGAAYYDLRGSIHASLTVNGGTASGGGAAEASAVAPLVTLGWRHALSESLRVYADFSGVRKSAGTLTGHLLNGTVGIEYFPWRNAGIALEYNRNELDLKAERESWEGRARIRFYGPSVFARLRF